MMLAASACTIISIYMIASLAKAGLANLEAHSSAWESFFRTRYGGGGPGLGIAIFPFLAWLLWWGLPPKKEHPKNDDTN